MGKKEEKTEKRKVDLAQQAADKEAASLETNRKGICDKLPASVEIIGVGLSRAIFLKGKVLNSDKSFKVHPKNPVFNWGYEGSGPAQLALAILLEYLPAELAMQYHQILKTMVIAKIKENNFKMTLELKLWMKDLLDNNLRGVDADGISPYYDVEEYITEEKAG